MPYRPRFVDVHGVKTCYVEAGEGEPLVCIHGGGPGASGEHGFRISNFIDALCLERVRMMGNSMGAYVAAKYTLDHPERVVKLLMISSRPTA